MGSEDIEINVPESVTSNEPEKKKRSRKKMLYENIRKQMEFYFSAANLAKDRWLKMKLEENECIQLTEFLKFNKIRNLTTDVTEIAKALRKSEILVVTEDMQVKRSTPVTYKEDEDSCVIYIEQVPSDADHEWLSNIFSRYGPIDYISIPKYRVSNKCKGFAFIEFSNAESAERAIEDYKESGNYLSTEIAPEELLSIATFDDHKCDGEMSNKCEKNTLLTEPADEENKSDSKKRKISNDKENPLECKKAKVCEDETTDDDRKGKDKPVGLEQDDGNTDELKKKKNRKKKSRKKKYSVSSETVALQILSKKDWKRLRNKYLNMQREKMKLLKRHLSQSQKRTEASRQNGKRQEGKGGVAAPGESSECKQYEAFTPGTIVKVVFDTPLVEVKQIKNEIRANPTVKYVDIKEGDNEIYIRLESSEAASSFCQNATWTNINIIEGEEESKYWDKVKKNREQKMSSQTRKKGRGKEKLMKKAEKVLGKHIIFDDI